MQCVSLAWLTKHDLKGGDKSTEQSGTDNSDIDMKEVGALPVTLEWLQREPDPFRLT